MQREFSISFGLDEDNVGVYKLVRRFKRLVVPGRFQPPHEGHVETVRYALEHADEVLVIIGSAQDSHSIRNPLTAGERWFLLDKLFRVRFGEEYCKRIKIIPVMDINMNKVWVQYLRLLLPEFDGVVSGNPLVKMLFEDMGLTVLSQPLRNRRECCGTVIRERILRGDESWKNCVPPEIIDDIVELGFVERLRRLAEEG